jgi:predicted nucleotide-binding protein
MINRFIGKSGAAARRQAILDQQCVNNDDQVADAILAKIKVATFKKGDKLMVEDGTDNDLFLIFGGRVSILVKGREMAIRVGGQHVGEMALIDTSAKRSATVIALEETVAAKIAEADFSAIANKYPTVWRRLALELGNRLRERSKHLQAPNPRPVIFIGSAAEGLTIAKQIQLGLSHAYVVPQVWTDNVFAAGKGTMEALEKRIKTADFGVLVCTPDDQVINVKRKVNTKAPRDNVILELGMCIGAMGRERAFLVRPRGVDLKIPTDLLGITPIDYTADDPANLAAHIAPVCTQIEQAVQREGPR